MRAMRIMGPMMSAILFFSFLFVRARSSAFLRALSILPVAIIDITGYHAWADDLGFNVCCSASGYGFHAYDVSASSSVDGYEEV